MASTTRSPVKEQAPTLSVFSPMRIREENRNMVLLATVTLFAAAIAGIISMADSSSAPAESKSAYAADQKTVRTVGIPFVPNVNPRER